MKNPINGYLFDLDGVLWLGGRLIPGVKETLATLRSQGKQLMFVSNTSARSRQSCLEQFAQKGIEVFDHEVFLATEETAKYLARLKPGARACTLGTKGLFAELEKAGIKAVPPNLGPVEGFDFLVVGKDRAMSFESMTYALRVLRAGAKLVALNCDVTVPGKEGIEPGAGALVAMLVAMTGQEPDVSLGKPGTLLLELALGQSGLKVDECIMIGDTIDADIVAGNRLGMRTVLVLTGNTAKEDLARELTSLQQPTLVLDSVNDLLAL